MRRGRDKSEDTKREKLDEMSNHNRLNLSRFDVKVEGRCWGDDRSNSNARTAP